MICSEFGLICDNCLEPFWHEGSAEFDLSLHSTADVRKMAKEEGWKRMQSNDLCKLCLEEMKSEGKKS
jgi:hypothetical protein